MKVPPKRKGNQPVELDSVVANAALNESPSEKEGKCCGHCTTGARGYALNESPSEKEGKCQGNLLGASERDPSMKVPPKRKGNGHKIKAAHRMRTLNESPSEKEGKSRARAR